MRDMDKNPYSKDEQRVAKFLFDLGAGGGDDPIGFILASHAMLAAERRMREDPVLMSTEPYEGHQYPDRHARGSFWATDEAWSILDRVKPGVIPGIVRAFLSGLFAGALVRIAKEGAPDVDRPLNS